MSETNDTPSLDHGTLTDSELEAVTGGIIPGESTDMGHKDWVDTSDPDPSTAWNELLRWMDKHKTRDREITPGRT
jgi:hypothetical protein